MITNLRTLQHCRLGRRPLYQHKKLGRSMTNQNRPLRRRQKARHVD